MTYNSLIDWFEKSGVEDLTIDEFGDFSDSEIQGTLLDFGVDRSITNDKSAAQRKLSNSIGFVSDVVFEKVTSSLSFITQVENAKDFRIYDNLINKRIEPILARSAGIEFAKDEIRKGNLDEPYLFLRKHSPQTLGGLTRQEFRRTEGLRNLF